jgi:lipopolysaccharide export LptBFGC system permease protein LptF
MEDYNKEEIFSKRVRAGKRTYFFDVKATRGQDYYITITESKKKSDEGIYVKHKIFLYKEDFNKFFDAFNETMNHVKNELLPEYDFDEYTRDNSGPSEESSLGN